MARVSEQLYDEAAEWIRRARSIVVFSGAGVSAESGIATFRDAGGIWERFDPLEVGTPGGILRTLERSPERMVAFMREVLSTLRRAKPNAAHRALGDLEQRAPVAGVVTQNVDGLHQEGGSSNVIELHGNTFRLRCSGCDHVQAFDRPAFFEEVDRVFEGDPDPAVVLERLPRCECGRLRRMDVVLFGEAVQQLEQGFALAAAADLMLVVGTSGQVSPAAELPSMCASRGGRVLVVNPEENAYAKLHGLWLPEAAGVALPEITRRVTGQ